MSDEVDLKRSRRKRPQEQPELDRLPPHVLEAEQGVLGSILLESKEAMAEARSKIPTADVFYEIRHRVIWETVCEMDDDNDPIDTRTVMARMNAFGQLDGIGGAAYLSSLTDVVPSAANLGFYINVVLEKYQLRQMIQLNTEATRRIYEHEGETSELIDWFETAALKIRIREQGMVSANCADSVARALDTIEMIEKSNGPIGLPTGYADFDQLTRGLHPSEMIVIAGRPSMGKSSLAMNLAENIAVNQNVPVGIFSLEMTKDALVLRTLCSLAKVNLRSVQGGFVSVNSKEEISKLALKLRKAPLYIDDTPGLTVAQLRARARRMFQQFGIKLFIIDYLQQMQAVIKRGENRERGVADMSTGIKLLARELDVPVIALSQLSRELEKDGQAHHRPKLSHLRESGAIEQDADVVGMLYRAPLGKNEEEPGPNQPIKVNLYIAKQRNGPTDDVRFIFNRALTRFESASKIADDDVPKEQSNLSEFDNRPPYADP